MEKALGFMGGNKSNTYSNFKFEQANGKSCKTQRKIEKKQQRNWFSLDDVFSGRLFKSDSKKLCNKFFKTFHPILNNQGEFIDLY